MENSGEFDEVMEVHSNNQGEESSPVRDIDQTTLDEQKKERYRQNTKYRSWLTIWVMIIVPTWLIGVFILVAFSIVNAEADKWVKMFPDQFFEDVNKMRGWSWDCKPRYMGKIINDIVYERIAPFVLEELRAKNPKLANGNRRYKFHQFLTSEEGKPLLKQHLAILHSFAMAADYNWGRFMELLDKAHPKQYQELAQFEEIEIGEK